MRNISRKCDEIDPGRWNTKKAKKINQFSSQELERMSLLKINLLELQKFIFTIFSLLLVLESQQTGVNEVVSINGKSEKTSYSRWSYYIVSTRHFSD